MNITYDHQIFARQPSGRISRYFYEIITRIARASDSQVHLFMGFHVDQSGLELHRMHFERFVGWKHHAGAPTRGVLDPINRQLFKRYVARRRPDIYHPTHYASLLGKGTGRKVVTVHDMEPERFPESFSGRDTAARDKRRSVQEAAGVICHSEATRRELLERLEVPEEKVVVIHPANSLTVPPLPDRLIADPYLLFVGGREGYKNFPTLLHAYASDPELHRNFQLLCFGGGEVTPLERALISRLGVGDGIRFMEGPDEVLASAYAQAHAVICPTLGDGFGFSPLEAMHHGCPVLASNRASMPEVVGEAGLLFNPDSSRELASKLLILLSDEGLRQRLIAAGRAREQLFSWDHCAEETLQFYRRIAES